MLVAIIIVSYNTCRLTLQAVNSVLKSVETSPTLRGQTELIIIDNNSQDESVTELKKIKSAGVKIKIIANSKNLGFAAANNQGFARAQGKYLYLLNSDTISSPDSLEKLVSAMERSDNLGILAANLQNPDGSHQPQGGSLPSLLTLASHLLMLDDLPLVGRFLPSTQHTGWGIGKRWQVGQTQLLPQGWVAATAMLIRKAVLTEVGDFDEQIFMYGEDMELCLRAAHHHYNIALHPQALVTHLGSASSQPATALRGELRAYLYIWSKHFPGWQMRFLRWLLRGGCYLRVVIFGTILRDHGKTSVYRDFLKEI